MSINPLKALIERIQEETRLHPRPTAMPSIRPLILLARLGTCYWMVSKTSTFFQGTWMTVRKELARHDPPLVLKGTLKLKSEYWEKYRFDRENIKKIASNESWEFQENLVRAILDS